MLPEYDGDHLGGKYVKGELQQSEIQEEKSSLSDRFGLWVPFHVFSQDRYLEAIKLCLDRWTAKLGRDIPWSKELEMAAIKWSHEKTKRCGRTAYQFSKNWVGKYLLK